MPEEILDSTQDTEQDFSTAFDDAADLFEEPIDTFDEDTETEATAGPGDESGTEEEESQEEIKKTSDADDVELDWQSLYADAKNRATHTQQRLSEVEAQFHSWRGRVEAEQAQRDKDAAVVANSDDIDLDTFMEVDPELLAPVQKLIEARVSERVGVVEKKVTDILEQAVQPLQKRVYETEEQAHKAAIFKAHPDAQTHLADGSLEKWMLSLPLYQQTGVQYVLQRGTADEVVQLLSDYKNATGKKAKESQKSTEKTSATSLVSQVQDAMAVKSAASTPATSDEEDDPKKLFDFYAKQLAEEEG